MEQLQELIDAAEEFCNKCDTGKARSVNTYNRFKKALAAIPAAQTKIEENKIKAKKWDDLHDKIDKFYDDEDNTEGGDLCDIGETAAAAFGYL